ncbi:MAG: hypothetical protein P8Z38_09595 [Robiginitalea sp.]
MKKHILLLALCIPTLFGWAQESNAQGSQADELAKKLQNPLASLISVPFQSNFDFGYDPADGSRWLMNVQPVVPMSISEDWNLIGRVILPVISQNDIFGESGNQTGLGDALVTGFFSPKTPTTGGLIWGVGPALSIPTATDDLLGSGKFSAGPSAVALVQKGSITYGALVNHTWSLFGDSDRGDVNATFFQPFLAKNFAGGYAVTMNTELLQNWEADASIGYLHLFGSKVTTLGDQMAQFFLGPRIPYGNGATNSWGFRAGITLLFPK